MKSAANSSRPTARPAAAKDPDPSSFIGSCLGEFEISPPAGCTVRLCATWSIRRWVHLASDAATMWQRHPPLKPLKYKSNLGGAQRLPPMLPRLTSVTHRAGV
jgi:hypothetical protein